MPRTLDVSEEVHLNTDDRRQVGLHSDRFWVLIVIR